MSWAAFVRELERERFDVSYLKLAERRRKAEAADTPTHIRLRRAAIEKGDR